MRRPSFRAGCLLAVLLVCLLNLVVFSAFRLGFWLAFHTTGLDVSSEDTLRAFFLGLRFDLRLALLLAIPLVACCWIPRLDPQRSRAGRSVWTAYLVGSACLYAMIYMADFAHYAWLHARIDANVLEHAHPLSIAARVVWETYPVAWIALGLAALLTLYARVLSRLVRIAPRWRTPRSGLARGAIGAAFAALFALGITGSVSGYPLRWSHAFFSTDPFTSALALNPVLYLVDTWPYEARAWSFDPQAVEGAYPIVASYLRLDPGRAKEPQFARSVAPARREPAPNVVIIFLESFGASKTGAFGNALDPTPHFDAIARESLIFRSFFVASLPTARSIFSVLTGVPDVHPEDSASRNPLLVRQDTIVNAFRGYEKLYFYTGNLAWGNLRGVLTHNIPDLRLYEDGDFASPRNDGWGISDLHLFEEANAVLRTLERPFIAFLQTSGNHPPNTIPADRGDFQLVRIEDPERLTSNDFRSLEELNSLRFLDYSLGHFFELARGEPYFQNTLFVLLGDHGSRGTGRDPLERIGLTSLHVPFVLYAPSLLPEPRAIDRVVSSLDVLPTVAALAGVPHTNRGLGRDMLETSPAREGYAFSRSGLIDREFYLFAPLERLYRYRSTTPDEDVRALYPEQFERMKQCWAAFHETARYLLHRAGQEEPSPSVMPSRRDPARSPSARGAG